jgi:hypothetical protein
MKNSMNHSVVVLGALLIGGITVPAYSQPSAQFQIPITVTNGANTKILTIGVSGDGDGGTIQDNTIGVDYDPSFGVYQELVAPPVPPQPYDFDARILTIPGRTPTFPTGLGGGVYKDFRGVFSSGQIDSFRINYTGDVIDAAPTTISWPADLINHGTAWVIRPLSGSEWAPVNMLSATSVVIPAGVLQKNALIIKTGLGPPEAVNVTFRVDMSVKMREYAFRPDLGDYVTVRGTFNDWGNSTGNVDTLKDADSDSVYVLTRGVPGTVQMTYKFWKSPRFGAGYEGTISDRTSSVPATPDTLPVVLFDNDSTLSAVSDYGAGWDMVSPPVTTTNDSVSHLYPGSTLPYAFAFVPGTGYQQRARMEGGTGYWAKFGSAGNSDISGTYVFRDSIDVAAEWNMIGSISLPVDTASIIQIPPGILSSVFFGYHSGYGADSLVRPGKAYWVKARNAGTLVLQSTGPVPGFLAGSSEGEGLLQQCTALRLRDALGGTQTLYVAGGAMNGLDVTRFEMPPVPPAGAFDARFGSGRMVEVAQPGVRSVFTLAIRTEAWPVTLSWEVKGDVSGLTLQAGAASRVLEGTGALRLAGPPGNGIAVEVAGGALPAEFALAQNYPNPFNPVTTIGYALAAAAHATVKVYDLLGRQVSVMVDEIQSAGVHTVQWNGRNAVGQQVASGIYLYRLDAAPVSGGMPYSSLRKMVLLK